jgi:hypothetical protein
VRLSMVQMFQAFSIPCHFSQFSLCLKLKWEVV